MSDYIYHPTAFIVGTATRGRSGYGVVLVKGKWRKFYRGESETLATPICAMASGVLKALQHADDRFQLSHINLGFEDREIKKYLSQNIYPSEPGSQELFRKIYEHPVTFTVVDCTGHHDEFKSAWRQARIASGTHSASPYPINDNLYKRGVIEVTICAFVKRTVDGVRLGAYGIYYEKGALNQFGEEMNEAGVIREPKSTLDVCIQGLERALCLIKFSHKHFEVRIKTASRPIFNLIQDFKRTGFKRYKNREGIDDLKDELDDFDKVTIQFRRKYGYASGKLRQARLLALNEFQLNENSTYWKNGIRKVYTDGSCEKNGQQGAVAGCGVFWGPNEPFNASFRIEGRQTNNRAEYEAIIRALEIAINCRIFYLIICTDCQLIIDSMNEWLPKWKRNGWKTVDGEPVENQDLLMRIDELMGKMQFVEFEKVAGHSGHEGNDGADALAKRAARIASGLK